MAKKPGKKGPDNFTTVFEVLFAGKQEIDFAQFLHDHPGLVSLLIDAARNGDEITLEMLEQAGLEEFHTGGESSDLASQLQLAVFLQQAAEQYNFNTLPWMEQREEPPAKKKPGRKLAKRKTTKKKITRRQTSGDVPIAETVANILGGKVAARKALKAAGSVEALLDKLRKKVPMLTVTNLRYILNKKIGISARDVLKGRSQLKKAAEKTTKRKTAGEKRLGRKPSARQGGVTTKNQIIQKLGAGSEKKARKALEAMFRKELGIKTKGALARVGHQLVKMGVKLDLGNVFYYLNTAFKIDSRAIAKEVEG